MGFDRSKLDPKWQRAFDYVEAHVGGQIVEAQRQPRWRPAWFLEIEKSGGERASVYFRGARGESDHGVYSLRHEFDCMQVLERKGVPVPHLYGFCDDPQGIVMDRAPGRINLATADSEEERRAVIDHYMELLARMHRLPMEDFEALGLERPASPQALALGDFDTWERSYRKSKSRPEPLIEFAIDWLRRNVPQEREGVAFLAGDSGQFLFDAGRVTAVIDFELAYLGDPAADLGALMSRDLSEPLGDLRYAVSRYEAHSGAAIDRDAIHYHAVRFGMVTPMSTAAVVAAPSVDTEYVQYLTWYLVYGRCPLEIIAHLRGIEVPPAGLPSEVETPYTVAHSALRDRLAAFDRGDEFQAYKLDAVQRLATYLERADRFGPSLDAADLDEAGELLGRRPESANERDVALEALVAANSGDLDAALVAYFIRRCQRQEFLLQPVARELEGAQMQVLD